MFKKGLVYNPYKNDFTVWNNLNLFKYMHVPLEPFLGSPEIRYYDYLFAEFTAALYAHIYRG